MVEGQEGPGSSLQERILADSELTRLERRLNRITVLRGNVIRGMDEGKLSQATGEARLAKLKELEEQTRQGPTYERWLKVYREAAEAARARSEKKQE